MQARSRTKEKINKEKLFSEQEKPSPGIPLSCSERFKSGSDPGSSSSSSSSSSSLRIQQQTTNVGFETAVQQPLQQQLLIRHLLHGAVGHSDPASIAQISSQLEKMGLLTKSSRSQDHLFATEFKDQIKQAKTKGGVHAQFWGVSQGDEMSRFHKDFEEGKLLGRGSFGKVVYAINKLDGRDYAIKKVQLKAEDRDKKMLREVTTLSRMVHPNIVQYYQAWIEQSCQVLTAEDMASESSYNDCSGAGDTHWRSSEVLGVSSWSALGNPKSQIHSAAVSRSNTTCSNNTTVTQRNAQQRILYIQMEYCHSTLYDEIKQQNYQEDDVWVWLRQICAGLAHIHSLGVLHRDLKPRNIFIDAKGNAKIGDFGLATKDHIPQSTPIVYDIEECDLDASVATNSHSTNPTADGEHTLGVGTALYRAPELSMYASGYNQCVDMFSLGVIFFEMIHPFPTNMKRVVSISALISDGVFPEQFVELYPKQADLIARLVSVDPTNRPSAQAILEGEWLPPKPDGEFMSDAIRSLLDTESDFHGKVVETLCRGCRDDYNLYF